MTIQEQIEHMEAVWAHPELRRTVAAVLDAGRSQYAAMQQALDQAFVPDALRAATAALESQQRQYSAIHEALTRALGGVDVEGLQRTAEQVRQQFFPFDFDALPAAFRFLTADPEELAGRSGLGMVAEAIAGHQRVLDELSAPRPDYFPAARSVTVHLHLHITIRPAPEEAATE